MLLETVRQQVIREAESIDDIEECAKLYEKGWKITEIAQSKDYPINSVLDALRRYISVDPADIEEAKRQADLEERAEFYRRRRPK